MGVDQVNPNQIADRYRLVERIGQGGSGIVWRAEDLLLERQVAMKELLPPAIIDQDDRRRLQYGVLREARAAARLHHPGAVAVYDVVEEGERQFIVMELVQAPDLSHVVADGGPLDPPRTAGIGLELLEVLEAAHQSGIVHRDVKPGNVLVPIVGRCRLSDFGIASLIDDPSITATGMIKGTPSYMSPEQAMAGTMSPATDLWSLGATLYFAVEGHAPFDKGQPIATLAAIAIEDHKPFSRAGALGRVLQPLFAKDPVDRPDHETLRRSLQTIATRELRTSRPPLGSVPVSAPLLPTEAMLALPPELLGPLAAIEPPATEPHPIGAAIEREAPPTVPIEPSDGGSTISSPPPSRVVTSRPPTPSQAMPSRGPSHPQAPADPKPPARPEAPSHPQAPAIDREPLAPPLARANRDVGDETPSPDATAAQPGASVRPELSAPSAVIADGALAVPDEDNAGRGTPRPTAKAQQPMSTEPVAALQQPVAPAPAQQPIAPVPAPGQQPVGPAPAQQPIAPAPAATQQPVAPAPAATQQPVAPTAAKQPVAPAQQETAVVSSSSAPPFAWPRPSLTARYTAALRRTRGGSRLRRTRIWTPAALIAALVLVALVIVARPGRNGTQQAPSPPATTAVSAAPTVTTVAASAADTSHSRTSQPQTPTLGVVPVGWKAYTDPTTGFKLAYPPTWNVNRHQTLTDFLDPASPTYLRIDHQTPPASTPDGPWYALEPAFAASNPGYQRIGITRTTFHGYSAAVWEYTYRSGAVQLHAIDMGMIVGDHGFGFNFQTTDATWTQSQNLLNDLENSFQP